MNRCSRCHCGVVIDAPEILGRGGSYLKCLGCGQLFKTPAEADRDAGDEARLREWRERVRRHWRKRE